MEPTAGRAPSGSVALQGELLQGCKDSTALGGDDVLFITGLFNVILFS